MSEFLEGRELRETKKTKSIAVKRLPLKGAGNQCSCKAFADSRRLSQIEVSARASWNREQSLQFRAIRRPEFVLRQVACVVNPAQNDQSAHLEAASQPRNLNGQISASSGNLGAYVVRAFFDFCLHMSVLLSSFPQMRSILSLR